MRNHSILGLPILLLCFSFCFMLTFSSLYAQKERTARQRTTATKTDLCKICCDCATLKKESEAYQERGCASIEKLCNAIAKSGTGPVVVGGSRNEFASNDCFCGQNNFLITGQSTSIIASIKGTARKAPIKVLIEILDSKGKKVFSGGQNGFNAFLISDGATKKMNKIKALTLRAKEAAIVQVPVRLKAGATRGKGVVKVIFFVEHPKTKKRMIIKKERRTIQIGTKDKRK